MIQRSIIWIGWFAVFALAFWIRVDDLGTRPIHFDEATGANIFSKRLENADYRFDPTHFHGPFLSTSTWPVAAIYGERNWQELSLPMLRTGPVIAGLLMVLSPLLWLRTIGPRAALGAGALLASSPLLVYYNRMYIHESWLALFGMIAAAAVFAVIRCPTRNRAILAGLAAGLMFATKETVVISLFSWTLAGAASWLLLRQSAGFSQPAATLADYLKPAFLFSISLLITGTIFYGQGLFDAFKTYFVYATTPGHDKPFGYYLGMLLWPKHQLGLWWSEGGIALFGLVACGLAAYKKKGVEVVTFLALGAVLHLLVYSLISYKTPWLMSLPWALACLLAGCVFLKGTESGSAGKRILLYTCFGLCLIFQTYQSVQANGRLSNHADNPYAYVPTSKNVTQLPLWLKKLDAFVGDPGLEPIMVIGQSYWPLPWYLRDFDTVGYWPSPPEDIKGLPIIISMPEQTAACNEQIADSHTALPRTLRSNVPITVHLRNDIWDAWTESE